MSCDLVLLTGAAQISQSMGVAPLSSMSLSTWLSTGRVPLSVVREHASLPQGLFPLGTSITDSSPSSSPSMIGSRAKIPMPSPIGSMA